jgi:CRISPR-associated protein Csm2
MAPQNPSGQRSGEGQQRGNDQRSNPLNFQEPSESDLRKIIIEGNVELLIKWADRIGKSLKDQDLKASQMRNVFGTVRQIQLRWDETDAQRGEQCFRDAILLIPKLGYFAKREKERTKRDGMVILEQVLTPALRLVAENVPSRRERFMRFAEFFEAIVAYHKKHGGEN